jgi:hypothetical protein
MQLVTLARHSRHFASGVAFCGEQHTWRGPLRGEEAMRRRGFIALIGSAAAVSSLLVPVARAQEAGRIYRLGVIAGPARQAPRIVAFFDELRGRS